MSDPVHLTSENPAYILYQIRGFIQKFYTFVEGVSDHHRNIDDLLSKVSSEFSSIASPY